MATNSARGLMGQYAGIVTRGVALIIDILIVIVAVLVISASLSLPLDFFLGINMEACAVNTSATSTQASFGFMRSWLCLVYGWLLIWIAFLTGPVYFIFLTTAGGQTIGKYVMGVRIVRVDGKQMSYIKALVRYLGYFVSIATLGIGFLWVIVDAQRRALHDHMAGTCVIYSWRAQENYFLINRIQRFFGRRRTKSERQAVVSALSTHSNDLVTLSVPGYDDLRNLLRIIQSGRQSGRFSLLGIIEYAKSADGRISRIDDEELAADVADSKLIADDAGFTRQRIEEIQTGIPNDHFALVVIARDDDIDAVVKLVSQRTGALIRRYDLGRQTQAPAGASRESVTVGNGAPATAASVAAPTTVVNRQTAMPVVAAAQPASGAASVAAPLPVADRQASVPAAAVAQPASGTTSTAVSPGAATAFNAQPIRPPSDGEELMPPAAAVPQGASMPADSAALLDQVKKLQVQQAQLEEQLQLRGQELVTLETRFRETDSQLASLRSAYDAQGEETAKLRSAYDAANSVRTRSPAIAALERRLAALPPAKLSAIDAAVAAGVMPRFVDTPQDLADIKGIGPTYEQRLYRAGIGAFWEVACLAADDLRALLEIAELQATQVDLSEIRADARRLAEESDSVGQIWDGQPPDDFEPIDGIGKVFEQRLYTAGIRTYRALADASPEQLAAIVKAQKPLQPDYLSWIAQARALLDKS